MKNPGLRSRDNGWPSVIFARMWKTLGLVVVVVAVAVRGYSQVPCPVSITMARIEPESIQLQFRNKGKLPIEQLSLACTPPATGKARTALCQSVNGIFYPGMEYDAEIPYAGAARHTTVVSVMAVQMAGGLSWNTHSVSPCRSVRAFKAK